MMPKRTVSLFLALAAMLVAAACAPRLQEIGAVTANIELDDTTVAMADGARLPLRKWEVDNPRAVIVGVHGMGDYSNAFTMPGEWFAERGIATYAYDQRGFGETGQRGVWAGSGVMVGDLKSVRDLIAERHPGVPLYVLGLSMGGAVTMVAQAQGLQVDGVILAAPAIWGWQAMHPAYKASLWVAAHTFPDTFATGSGLEIQPSDNIEMLRAYSKDPLVLYGSRIDAIYGLVTLMDEAYDAADNLTVPALYLYGTKDEIVPAGPTYNVMGRVPEPRRLVLYKNGYHMLLRDLQREVVWTDILAWIDNRDAVLPSGEEVEGELPTAVDAPVNDAQSVQAVRPSSSRTATQSTR